MGLAGDDGGFTAEDAERAEGNFLLLLLSR
jgi:hypothetical protein